MNKAETVIYRTIEKKGYGAYYIMGKHGGRLFGCFHEPITLDDIDRFKDIISYSEIHSNGSYMTGWNDEINRAKAVVGVIMNPFKIPEDQDELDIKTELENEENPF